MSDFDDFIKGQKDCANGIKHKEGMSEEYNRGYSVQYELEQIRNELCQSASH